ncbi:hypothetical protein B0H19DRAFT_1076023 [Mycena capillaripes]|nr:hypothetical protein B0H19DRAFT_1076023 [Mycena capillaripes]
MNAVRTNRTLWVMSPILAGLTVGSQEWLLVSYLMNDIAAAYAVLSINGYWLGTFGDALRVLAEIFRYPAVAHETLHLDMPPTTIEYAAPQHIREPPLYGWEDDMVKAEIESNRESHENPGSGHLLLKPGDTDGQASATRWYGRASIDDDEQ